MMTMMLMMIPVHFESCAYVRRALSVLVISVTAHACTEALEEDDDVPFTDKKKSKIKLPFSTKKIMKNVGLKDKDKTGKEKPTKEPVVSQQPVARVQHTPSPEVQAKMQDSEQWKAFQEMQERISQMVSQTSEKVSQMEQGFEDELSKLTAVQSTSPWAVLGVDDVTSPPTVKSPGDREDEKTSSWVGFEDTFDVAADDATDQQQADDEQVGSNHRQVGLDSHIAQVGQVNDSSSALPADVTPPRDNDVITRYDPASETQPAVVAETGGDNGGVAMVTNNAQEETITAQVEEPETVTTSSECPEEEAVDRETVDPFDVSNVVTAMKSGKPIFEILDKPPSPSPSAAVLDREVMRKTVEERRERDRQITAAMRGADSNDDARSRPRPRPQAAVKSANPFKITLAASNIEPAAVDDDVDDAYDADDFTQATTTTFSAANPFARTDFDQSETANVDSGIWDPFSGADATTFTPTNAFTVATTTFTVATVMATTTTKSATTTLTMATTMATSTFTATFDFDEHHDDTNNYDLTTKTRDKDADSRSSKSSFEEPEETLEPLDPFYPPWDGKCGWNMFLRTPLKKKLTQNRAWKPVFVRLCEEKDAARVRVYTSENESTCLHEMTLGTTFALRQMQLQQFDQYSKCHTVKLEHVFYVEKLALKSDRIAPTLRDVTKVRDLKGLKDLVHRGLVKDLVHKPKTTMLLSHSPQATESLKFGTLDLVAYKQFIRAIEDTMFVQKAAQRGKMATSYTKDEIRVDLIDEYYADIDHTGHISYHKARVRLFCIAFLTGNPVVEIGINDKRRRGNEVVGRADIIPIKTEDWIKYEDVVLNDIVDKDEYEKSRLIKCRPPDASRFEAMRFRVRPRANVELPLQISVQMSVVERRIEIRADVMIPGYFSTSRRASQVACENIQIRFPIPEALVYMFRVEKRFRYGSVHSSKKKPGRIKGLERLTMFATGGGAGAGGGSGSGSTIPTSTPIVLQASSGLAKYEHLFRAVVWRISRLPERNQGQST